MAISRQLALVGFGPVHALALRQGVFDGWQVTLLPEPACVAAPLVASGLFESTRQAFPARELARQAGITILDGTVAALDMAAGEMHFHERPTLKFDALSVEISAAPDLAIVHGGALVGPLRADMPDADIELTPFLTAQQPLVVGAAEAAGVFALNGPKNTRLVIPAEMAEASPLQSPHWRAWLDAASCISHLASIADLTAQGVLTAEGHTISADVTLVVTEAIEAEWVNAAPLVHRIDPFADCSGRAVRHAVSSLEAALRNQQPPEKPVFIQPLTAGQAARRVFQQPRKSWVFRRFADHDLDALMQEIGTPHRATLTLPTPPVERQVGEWPAGLTLWQHDGASPLQAHGVRSFSSLGFEPYQFGRLAAQAALAPLTLMGCQPQLASVVLGAECDSTTEKGIKQELADRGLATAFSRNQGAAVTLALLGAFHPATALGHAGAKAGDVLLLIRSPVSRLLWQADCQGALSQFDYARFRDEALRPLAPLIEALLAFGATAATLVEEDGLLAALTRLALASHLVCALNADALVLPQVLHPFLPQKTPAIEGLIGGTEPTAAEYMVLTGGAFPPAVVASVSAERLAECSEALKALGESFCMIGMCAESLPGLTGGVTVRAETT